MSVSSRTAHMSGCRPMCRAFGSTRAPKRLSGATILQASAAHVVTECCQASTSQPSDAPISRRSSLALALGTATLAAWQATAPEAAVATEAVAEAQAALASSSAAETASSGASGAVGGVSLVPFNDRDYELQVPADFTYLETPFEVRERGPQPERSPVRARFQSADGKELVYIIVRNAQVIKPTLLQVADLTQYGNAIEVAKLLLPRGSKLLAASTQQVELPTRSTPLGDVAVPPKTYFMFEFTTPDKLHVAMTAAAQRGKVYVCGASTDAQQWDSAKQRLSSTVATFRLIPPVGASS